MLHGIPSDTVHPHDPVGSQSNTDVSTHLSPVKEDEIAHQEDTPGEPSPQATPATKGGQTALSYHKDTSPHHDSTTGKPNTTILPCINRTPIEWFSKKQRSDVTDLPFKESNTNALMPIIEQDVTAHEPTVHNARLSSQTHMSQMNGGNAKQFVTCDHASQTTNEEERSTEKEAPTDGMTLPTRMNNRVHTKGSQDQPVHKPRIQVPPSHRETM